MNLKNIVLILAILGGLYSCTEIIEPNISGERIVLLAPANNLHTTISTQQFWWDEMEFADNYQLQVVTPEFYAIEQLILDTIIASNKFTWNLAPGQYQWRVRGRNDSYSSDYTTWTLTIDSTNDISQDFIILLEPANHDTSNQIEYFFRWQKLYNAQDYNFQVLLNGVLIYSLNTISDTISYALGGGDGTYTWQVRGQNAVSNTQYSSRGIFIDTQSPLTPSPLYPGNNVYVPDSVTVFEWERGVNSGSSIKDSLRIARDILMTQLVVQEYVSTSWYADSLGPGIYYWQVKSIDAAGNRSDYSFPWMFTVE